MDESAADAQPAADPHAAGNSPPTDAEQLKNALAETESHLSTIKAQADAIATRIAAIEGGRVHAENTKSQINGHESTATAATTNIPGQRDQAQTLVAMTQFGAWGGYAHLDLQPFPNRGLCAARPSRCDMQPTFAIRFAIAAVVIACTAGADSMADESKSPPLHARQRVAAKSADGADNFQVVEKAVDWEPRKTALIICDMWDDHWCKGAARRVTELAGPMNKLVHRARDQGVFVIHAPSTCVDFYKDTPGRRRAQAAPQAKPPVALSQATRWGTRWCYPDPKREPSLPIDDSDMGCDCPTPCEIGSPWTRQIALIDIEEPDAISDDGQEVFNLLAERGIDRLLIAGVHLNMCVLGRSFAIRQMANLGKQVVLVRDMTDTMYNHRMKPYVDHFSGTDLVVEHVERYWCPTITSVDLLGGAPFRFRADERK